MANIVTVSGSKVTLNGRSVTVVNQHKLKGTYAKELSAHGCGACCASFALAFLGKKITPAEVLKKAVSLWGKWPKHPLISANGIAAILKKYGFKAKSGVVTKGNRVTVKTLIDVSLKAGKPVICWTAKGFAAGDHYVLAVGYNKQGRVVVANSGNKGPVNVVTLDYLCKCLQSGTGADKGWYRNTTGSAGFVIVEPKIVVKKPTTKTNKKPVSNYSLSTLKFGAKGQQVKALQKLLGGLKPGGAFGIKTKAKVVEYQKKHGLSVTGVVDAKTWESLLSK